MNKKIKIKNQAIWPHLRSGWSVVNKKIILLNNPNSRIVFEDYLDGVFGSGKTIKEPWVGFFHNTIKNHFSTNSLYGFKNDTSLGSTLDSEVFKSSLKNCKGIFTLSGYLKKFIQKKYPDLPVESLFLCTEDSDIKFNFDEFSKNPSIVTIGHWQRLFYNINKIKGIEKYFLKWADTVDIDWWFEKQKAIRDPQLKILERLDNNQYDNLLEKTVVFLELFDAAANNIIVECIVRNNPIIVNRLPGLFDYLGEGYPLFYDNYAEAQKLVTDHEKIFFGYEYLKKLNKEKFNSEYFMNSFVESKIYKYLPSYRIF
jgi:hypothetical protein